MKKTFLTGGILFSAIILIIIFSNNSYAQTNLIPNPSLENAAPGGLPQSWLKGRWGSNTAVFTYPVAGVNGSRAAKVELSSRVSGDAKWYFSEIPVKPDTSYTFSDSYISNVSTYVTVQYRLTDGSLRWVDIANPGPASGFTRATGTFRTPANAAGLTIFHLINRDGNLTIDDFSLIENSGRPRGLLTLTFDDGWKNTYDNVIPILSRSSKLRSSFYLNDRYFGFPAYITENQALNLQTLGHEVGSHTTSHVSLVGMTQEQMEAEVLGNVQALKNIGIARVETFAYPFGAYNTTVENFIKSAGFIGARTSDGGFNGSSANRFLLARQNVGGSTTVDQVRQWIDDAITRDVWLVLVFHKVDNVNADAYTTTPERFEQMVNYALARNIPMDTLAGGIRRIYLK